MYPQSCDIIHDQDVAELVTIIRKMIKNSNFKSQIQDGRILSSIVTALILGTLEITFVLAFTALIFPPELSAFFTQGMAILLFGTVICFLILALFSCYPGTIGSAQDIPASISAVMAVSIVAAMGNQYNSFEVFSTVIAAMATASFISASLLIIMAFTGLGKIIRYIPYPVIGGLLISTGWILSDAGLSMMPDQWLIGSIFAIVLLVTRQIITSPWVLPVLLITGIIAINLYLSAMGFSTESARELGFLLDVELNKIPFIPPPTTIIDSADWKMVFEQLPTILSLCLITCLVVLIQISSIEVIVKQEIEPKRELYVTGIANLIVAFCCGLISYHHISSTTLAYKMGANTRIVGVFTAMICMLVFLTNSKWMEFLPLPLLAGLILYLGLEFIYEWLILAYQKLPRIEYLIMLAIFACAIFVNFPAAILLGTVCGTLLFLFQYNSVGILDSKITGDQCISSVMRSSNHAAYLSKQPDAIAAFKLKGMLYFGTAHELFDITKKYIDDSSPKKPEYIIFDFKNIAEVDSTALMSLMRTHQYLNEQNITLIMSSLTGRQVNQIKTFYTSNDLIQSLCLTDSLDHAIEYAQDSVLTLAGLIEVEQTDCLDSIFENQSWSSASISALREHLQKKQLHDHQLLIRAGENNNDIYLIASGKLDIVAKDTNSKPVRLRVLTPGMVVGEMSFYTGLPRSADVIANGDTIVYQLSSSRLDALQHKNPDVAIMLHKYFAKIMAERLIDESRLHLIRSI